MCPPSPSGIKTKQVPAVLVELALGVVLVSLGVAIRKSLSISKKIMNPDQNLVTAPYAIRTTY
jgi:hypothetical protein